MSCGYDIDTIPRSTPKNLVKKGRVVRERERERERERTKTMVLPVGI